MLAQLNHKVLNYFRSDIINSRIIVAEFRVVAADFVVNS
ncbi:hypothetical protein SDC9_150556 [bioreactor metagenome]|uniref:Uncharacterized protein n=1 Tax=bioreactor metagenome TaxID=1076179 RepID=A0A645EQ97_9ZZZZ